MALRPLEQAILVVAHRLTSDTYDATDSDAIRQVLTNQGHDLPALFPYKRMIMGLKREGYLSSATATADAKVIFIELSDAGREIAEAGGDPFERVQTGSRSAIASDIFRDAFPGVFEPWADAERLLWADDVKSQLTTIGHKVREATQAFATALVEQQKPPDVEPDKTKVEKRLGAVIAVLRPKLGEAHREVLESLGDLWEANNKLIQRQEHGARKEGEPVDWHDARRIVYLTTFLMIEFVSIIESIPPDPPATLEGGGIARYR